MPFTGTGYDAFGSHHRLFLPFLARLHHANRDLGFFQCRNRLFAAWPSCFVSSL